MRAAAAILLVLELLSLNACGSERYDFVLSRACQWPESKPDKQAMDPAKLEEASGYLVRNKPESASLLVARHGALVFERYYGSATRNTAGNVKSISKGVLSALAGIAISERRIRGVDDRVADYIPEEFQGIADARARDLRIRHLLTMTAGLSWTENGSVSQEWMARPEPNHFALSRPFVASPGEKFEYSTALAHLLSTVITRATGMSTLEYATDRLFRPLGITCARWERLAGVYFGGSEAYLTPRDVARLGELYLRRGRWNGRQVVPEAWIAESTSAQVAGYYGYMWWIRNPAGHRAICALGAFGQCACVVPDLDLVIVHTSRPALSRSASLVPLEIIPRFIVPAVRK